MSIITLRRPNVSARIGALAAASLLVIGLLPSSPAAAVGLTTVGAIEAALCPTAADPLTGTAVLTESTLTATTSTLTVADGCVAVLDLDGKTLEVRNVVLGAGSTLTIKDAPSGGGTLVADASDSNDRDNDELAGIQTTAATLVITSGTVIARGGNDEFGRQGGAGIGGGKGGAGGSVMIAGGTVHAAGGGYGAGIGGGAEGAGGTVTISDGTVTAEGGDEAAGIGGGRNGAGGTVTISGGTVTAEGGDEAAGIGGGRRGDGGTVTISDGTVTAVGGDEGAGIGGGSDGVGGTVAISGGEIEATGNDDGAGIGGGYAADGGTVVISGGNVTAISNAGRGAGIGGGKEGDGGTVEISDGTVTATGGDGGAGIGGGLEGDGGTVVIAGGTVHATGVGGGAGIGGGREVFGSGGAGGTVTISGGSVVATAGSVDAQAIGAGEGGDPGVLTLGPGAVRVDSSTDTGFPVTSITFTNVPSSSPAGPSFFAPGGVQPSQPVGSAAFVRADGSPLQLAASAPGPDQVRYAADGIRVTLQGGTGTGVARGLVANAAAEIVCEVCIAGLAAGQVIEVWLFSTPRLVAAHLTDDAECQLFVVPLSAPLDGAGPVATGAHTLQFTLATADGLEAVNVGLTVGGPVPASVPAGEGPAMPFALVALGLVVLVGIRRMVLTNA